MPSISDLYLVEVSTDDQPIRWTFGSLLECQGEMDDQREKDPTKTWTVRSARLEDVEAQLLSLEEKRKAVQFAYDYSPWGMGMTYRRQIQEIDERIRLFRSYIEQPSVSPVDGSAPAHKRPPTPGAGATMTLADAEDAVMRPEATDAILFEACKVIDAESVNPFYRDIATRMIRHFEETTLEVGE